MENKYYKKQKSCSRKRRYQRNEYIENINTKNDKYNFRHIIMDISIIAGWIPVIINISQYYVKTAYYNYFKIDTKYMTINYMETLANLIKDISIGFLFSVLVILAGITFNKCKSGWKKSGLASIYMTILLGINTVYLKIYFNIAPIEFITMTKQDLKTFAALQFFLIVCELIIIVMIWKIDFLGMAVSKRKNKLKATKNNFINDRRTNDVKFLLISFAAITFVILVYIYQFYSIETDNCRDLKEFKIINENGKYYVIVTEYQKMYYTYQCNISEEDNTLTVHTDIQKFINMNGIDTNTRVFNRIEGFS